MYENAALYSTAGTEVPLKSVAWDIVILESVMEMTISQFYRNETGGAIEAEYVFPIDVDMALYGMTIQTATRTLEGKVMAKETAAVKYNEALARGHTAVMANYDEGQRDLIRMHVGNLSSGESVEVRLRLTSQLSMEENMRVLRVPSAYVPRYRPSTDTTGGGFARQPTLSAKELPYTWGVSTVIKARSAIMKVSCSGTDIAPQFSPDRKEASARMSPNMQMAGADFVVRFETADTHSPVVLIQKAKEYTSYVAVLSFAPPAPHRKSLRAPGEFIFVLDCSGSMAGFRIEMAKKALNQFIGALMPDCQFNVFLFGSSYRSLFPHSDMVSKTSKSSARNWLKKVAADLGGTEMLGPLRAIFELPVSRTHPRNVILITDGAVSNEAEVVNLVKEHKKDCRVHCFGIGSGASSSLIKETAKAGNGCWKLVAEHEVLDQHVLTILHNASRPALTDLHVTWPDCFTLKWSSMPNVVYSGESFSVFALCDAVGPGKISVVCCNTGTRDQLDLSAEITKEQLLQLDTGRGLYSLAAKNIINDYNLSEAAEVSLATAYSVLSPHTSFLAVDRKSNASATALSSVIVPTPTVRPWAMPDLLSRTLGCDSRRPESGRKMFQAFAQVPHERTAIRQRKYYMKMGLPQRESMLLCGLALLALVVIVAAVCACFYFSINFFFG